MNKTIQLVAAIAVGIASLIWGELNEILIALIILTILDYVTGVLVAVVKKRLSSAIGAKGIAKKVFIFILVAVGHILGTYVLGSGETCRNMIATFYIVNESISIIENSGKLGLPLPKKLLDILIQLKEEDKNVKDQKTRLHTFCGSGGEKS